MKHFLPGFLVAVLLLAGAPALAADTAAKPGHPHVQKKNATHPDISAADRKAMAAEEKDRLAREKKELTEREKLLEGQLATSQKLVAEKEALLKQMQAEINALKTGKPVPAAPATPAATKPAK